MSEQKSTEIVLNNETKIRTEKYEQQKNKLKKFSSKVPGKVELKTVPQSKGPFGLADYKVTGSDYNKLAENIQDLLIEQNKNTTKIIREFSTIYETFTILDNDYIKRIIINFQEMQGTIKESSVKEIVQEENGWKVVTDNDTYYSDKLVIAAGPWSNDLIKPLGYDLPLFPMRGCHQHFKVNEKNTIHHSMFDMDKGFVMGPMQQGIRITTGAEMTTMNAPKNFGQLNTVLKLARKILPLEDAVESEAWAGSRPCMPDMKPVIGPAPKHDKLWFAFGHSHQGFTLGPMTGRIVEEMIHEKPLLVDIKPFSADRFSR